MLGDEGKHRLHHSLGLHFEFGVTLETAGGVEVDLKQIHPTTLIKH